jgi:hypothetical protein
VPVGGERAGLDQDAPPGTHRAVEAREHQVQIHGERVHRDHFTRPGAHERGEAVAQVLVIGHPWAARVLVPFDGALRPLIELLEHELARRERLQAERVTAKVDERRAALVQRQREALAQVAQRVRSVERAREREDLRADRPRAHTASG